MARMEIGLILCMLIRKFLIVVFYFLVSTQAYTQFIYYDVGQSSDILEISKQVEEARLTRDSLQHLGFVAETFTIFEVDNNLWMTVDGRFDVFEWRHDKWNNLYTSTYHGYNYKSQQFTYKERLFSYRGYGYWREHGEIIEFLPEKGVWEIIPESIRIPFGIGYVSDSLFYVHSDDCYEVNLLKQTVKIVPCKFDIRGEIPHGREYNLQDYVLIFGNLKDGAQIPLISKEYGEVYLSQRNPFTGLRDQLLTNSLIYIRGNTLKIVYPDDRVVEYSVDDELQYYNLESCSSRLNKKWLLVFLGMLVIIIFIAIHFVGTRLKDKSEFDILTLFDEHKGTLIDSEALDQILGINDIKVYETRKFKRASLIREINKLAKVSKGSELILREKDPRDKRFFLYNIKSI